MGALWEPSCSHLPTVSILPDLSVPRSGRHTARYRAATCRRQPWRDKVTPLIRMYWPSRSIKAPCRLSTTFRSGSAVPCSPRDGVAGLPEACRSPVHAGHPQSHRSPSASGVGEGEAKPLAVSPQTGHSHDGRAVPGRTARYECLPPDRCGALERTVYRGRIPGISPDQARAPVRWDPRRVVQCRSSSEGTSWLSR
jgi:hypothetical protein